MTTEGNESMELDCYEAVEAFGHHSAEVIHLGMDVQNIEGGFTYWNVYVPERWDHGRRLLLLTEEEFKAVGQVLLLEALGRPEYSVLNGPEAIAINNLVAPMGLFHLEEVMHQCPQCSQILIPLGNNHWVCDKCAVTLDGDGEEVALIEDEDWVEIDPQTQEFDDALGIVRDDKMMVIAFPAHLKPLFEVNIFGDWVLKTDEEVAQAYKEHGGPNHSNHDLFAEKFYCNDDGHLLTPTGQGYYHCPECDRTVFISDEDLALGKFKDQ